MSVEMNACSEKNHNLKNGSVMKLPPEVTVHGFRERVLIYDSMTPNESRPNVTKQVTFTDKNTAKKFLFSKDSLFLKGTEKLILEVEKLFCK